jgi:hypothetical protein
VRGIESAAGVRLLPGTPWPWAAPVSPARAVPTWSGFAGRSDRPTTRRGFGRVTNCQMRGNNAYEIEQTRQHLLNQTTSHQELSFQLTARAQELAARPPKPGMQQPAATAIPGSAAGDDNEASTRRQFRARSFRCRRSSGNAYA